jgi:uncharacterized protein YgbK (DUF1537 family)
VIYIIADDLTGANDTGVQFARRGYRTRVVIAADSNFRGVLNAEKRPPDVEVFVIDTETREVAATTAQQRIRRVLEHLHPANADLVYKKIDSTLRGNIGVELEECLRILQKDVCLLTPSFPLHKRITVGGYLIVHDQPLGVSEYYRGNLEPGEASFIPTLLKPDTTLPIVQITLQDVMAGPEAIGNKIRELGHPGPKILVIDALSAEQLKHILRGSLQFDGSVLYAGSAGLANALAELYAEQQPPQVVVDVPPATSSTQERCAPSPVIVVSGSRRALTQTQIQYVQSKFDLLDINFDLTMILADRQTYLEQWATHATQAIRDGHHLVIHPDSRYLDPQVNAKLLWQSQLDVQKLGELIRGFLGELMANIMDNAPVRNIILTGGDTAIGVCSALRIDSLNIVAELLPGIPLAHGMFKADRNLNIVTKAGGFGAEDTLYLLIEAIAHR